MKFTLATTPYKEITADILAVPIFEDEKKLKDVTREFEGLEEAVAEEKFEGKSDQAFLWRTNKLAKSPRLFLIGLGKKQEINLDSLRQAAAKVMREARKIKGKKTLKASIVLDQDLLKITQARDIGTAIAEGAILGDYKFEKYKKKEDEGGEIEEFIVCIRDEQAKAWKSRAKAWKSRPRAWKSRVKTAVIQAGIKRGEIASRATILARDLVNEPPSRTTPKMLAQQAEEIANSQRGVKVELLDKVSLKKLGMEAILGISQGSDEPPYLIHLSYTPRGAKKRVALVGKGITFDSGGLSLKPDTSMETMKLDMSGAAAILGVFSVISEIKPPIEVHGIIASCENMPSGKAIKPGDVVKSYSGKTIEILNTDAEGRVILSDALAWAHQFKPDAIIDLATLTGACIVALGEEITGLFTNNPKLGDKIKKSAELAGEKVWELPLVEEYKKQMKSNVADIKNTTKGRWGGAITAALFLEEFVENVPWAHLDIAGPAWAESDDVPYIQKGGTGFGVRTLINYLFQM